MMFIGDFPILLSIITALRIDKPLTKECGYSSLCLPDRRLSPLRIQATYEGRMSAVCPMGMSDPDSAARINTHTNIAVNFFIMIPP